MKEALVLFLSQYGYVIAAALVASLAMVMVYMLPLVYQLFQYLKSLAEKNLSQKVAERVKDAIDKLYNVVKVLIESESTLIREEILKAIADGKIDDEEIKQIRKMIAEKALSIITPEIETIKRYLTGQAIMDYVVAVVTSQMVKFVKDQVAKNGRPNGPFVPNSSTNTELPQSK